MKSRNAGKRKMDVTVVQFEAAMEKYASTETREIEIGRKIEQEVNNVMAKYEEELTTLADKKSEAFEAVQSYCQNNKETLFSKRRSIGTLHGVAGFRLGTPRLQTRNGVTWDKVLISLKEKLPAYVRTVEEPAKSLLLADRNKENVAPVLFGLGLLIVQDELFYIETKKAA